jgi:alpha-1,2-mannosyltransferase
LAVILWIIAVAAVSIRLVVDPVERGNVYLVFARAGLDWVNGEGLYYDTDYLFRYPPLSAALFAPFGLLPDRVGGILWRLLGVAALVGAWHYWKRSPAAAGWPPLWDAAVWLLMLPLVIGNVNNGQTNVIMAALMIVATAATTRQAWWLAAGCLTAAISLKLYPLALALLLAVLFPRALIWRLCLCLIVSLVLPVAMQRPEYVWQQYVDFVTYTPTDQRMEMPLADGNRDLWMLLRVWGIPMSVAGYRLLQLGTAAGLALVAWQLRRQQRTQAPALILALATGWMLLCGPATESATYMLAGPVLAAALTAAWTRPTSLGLRAGLTLSFLMLTVAQMASWTPWTKQIHAWGLQPAGVLLATGAGLLVAIRTQASTSLAVAVTPLAQPA